MKHSTRLQLEKMLALADSDHDSEAVLAVRKARALLGRHGLSFKDLAAAASSRTFLGVSFNLFGSSTSKIKLATAELHKKILDLQIAVDDEHYQADNWRQKAALAEQKLRLSQAETERWQQLARETVEKLWDLGLESCANGCRVLV